MSDQEINRLNSSTEKILALELKPLPKSKASLEKLIREKEREMREAARQLDFELAAILRDEIRMLLKAAKEKGKTVAKG